MHRSRHHLRSQRGDSANLGRLARTQPRNHRSAAAISAWNASLWRGRRISARPTSVIAQGPPHASTALPPAMPAKQMKSVITLDLWLNRLWQHWKVVNAIGFCVCISVFANKSSAARALQGRQSHTGCSYLTHP